MTVIKQYVLIIHIVTDKITGERVYSYKAV